MQKDIIHIKNVAKAIYLNKKDAPGIAGNLARIQKEGIKGVLVEEYETYIEGPYLKGTILNKWLYDSEGFRKKDILPETQPYDRISSPYPCLKFAYIDEEEVAINCFFGPLAARGFICKLSEQYNFKTLEHIEGARGWIS